MGSEGRVPVSVHNSSAGGGMQILGRKNKEVKKTEQAKFKMAG